MLALGLSPFIMQSTESLVNITLNASLQHYGGDLYVGAMTIIGSVMQMILMPMQGLTQGRSPLSASQFRRPAISAGQAHLPSAAHLLPHFSVSICLFVELFPQLVVQIFNSDPELIDVTSACMRIYAAGIWAMGAQTACQQSFVAIGQAKISIFLALLRKIILLIPLALVLPFFMGTTGVFTAEPIADIGAATTTSIMFAIFFKRFCTANKQRPRPQPPLNRRLFCRKADTNVIFREEFMANIWHDIRPERIKSNDFVGVIEIEKGSKINTNLIRKLAV